MGATCRSVVLQRSLYPGMVWWISFVGVMAVGLVMESKGLK